MKWQIKAAIQKVLSLTPGGEHLNFIAQRAADHHSPQAKLDTFRRQMAVAEALSSRVGIAGKRVVEIGSGWDAIGVIALSLLGADEIHTFDRFPHVRMKAVQQLLRVIVENVPEYRQAALVLLEADSLAGFFQRARAHYHAPGDATRTGLPAASVDLVYTFSVLEHIPQPTVEGIMAEIVRILKPGGTAFHHIDLNDNYVHSDPSISWVNFLRFDERTWSWANSKLHYQNRLRTTHYLEMIARHHGTVTYRWEELRPEELEDLRNMKQRAFAGLDAEVLATTQLDVDVRF